MSELTPQFFWTAFVVKVSAAHVRKFNKFGSEEVPDDMKKDVPSKVSTDKMMQLIGEGSVVPKAFNLGVEITNLLHPATADCFLFWIDTDKVKNLNFKDGEEVLVRTLGDSIILDKMARADLDSFEGVEHGKLLSQVSSRTDRHADGDKPLPGDDVQGVADDEWD